MTLRFTLSHFWPLALAACALLSACDSETPRETGPPLDSALSDAQIDTGMRDGSIDLDDGVDATSDAQTVDSQLSDQGHRDGNASTDAGAGDMGMSCGEPEEIPDCSEADFLECEGREGTNSATLLIGTVVDPVRIFCNGQVLLDGDTGRIACVGEDCSGHPLAAEATIVCGDIIAPGLIDPHNHMSFNTLPPWRHGERLFQNRDEWRPLISRELYGARPNTGDPVAARYNELRLLMAGTTAVHKADNVVASHDHVRNLDRGPNANRLGYGESAVEECVFPLTAGCNDAPDYAAMRQVPERSYIAHVAEGIDARSRDEFDRFVSDGQLGPATTIIHCVSCGGPELSAIRAAGAKLVWSPQSNIDLYGATLDVPTALNMGITVALGPDWTASGTMNQLAEMKCAQRVSSEYYGGRVSDRDIVRMVTDLAATAMGVDDLIGRLREGMHGDAIVLRGDRQRPYSSIVGVTAQSVRGVFVGSKGYYGDPDTLSAGNQRNPLCEEIDVCGNQKTICVRDVDQMANATDPDSWPAFGFDEVTAYVQRVAQRRRPDDLPEWLEYAYEAFPLFECAPTFSCRLGNASVSGFITADDSDGDDTANINDNCPAIFNPTQRDLDGDGVGDACDVCPWSAEECPCRAPTGVDLDADGLRDEMDNCPRQSNPEQSDGDGDGYGDVCDMCPELADGPMAGCPTTIPQTKQRQVSTQQFISLEGVVTATLPDFAPATQAGSFFMQSLPGTADADAVQYSGIFVYMGNRSPGVRTPAIGEHIRITGMYNDFYGQVQLTQIQRIDELGETGLPTPHNTEALTIAERPEPLDSVLLCINEVTVTDLAPPRGPGDGDPEENYEFEVTHLPSGASVRVNDGLYRVVPFPELGVEYAQVCGVHRLANGAYKIEPRDAQDLDNGPPRVISLGPEGTYVRAGQPATPQTAVGDQLTVELNTPAPMGGVAVLLTSSSPELLSVPASVNIPAGETLGSIPVTGVRSAEAVTISARIDPQADPLSVDVRVYDNEVEPSALSFGSPEYSVVLDDDVVLQLSMDAPSAGRVQVSLETALPDALGHPIRLEFPAEHMTVEFSLQGQILGDHDLYAEVGDLSATTEIHVIETPRLPVINEIDADMSGDEVREFIEIYNPGALPVPLAGWSLELINGSNGNPYKTIALDTSDAILPPLGYLVVGDDVMADSLPEGIVFIPLGSRGSQHDIQNGNPDGAQLLSGDVVVDAMSYAGVIEGVTEGAEGAPDDANNEDGETLSRCANGADTNDNAADFVVVVGTPGLANDCPAPPVPDAGIADVGVPDGGPADGGAADSGVDAGLPDAGPVADAGVVPDAAPPAQDAAPPAQDAAPPAQDAAPPAEDAAPPAEDAAPPAEDAAPPAEDAAPPAEDAAPPAQDAAPPAEDAAPPAEDAAPPAQDGGDVDPVPECAEDRPCGEGLICNEDGVCVPQPNEDPECLGDYEVDIQPIFDRSCTGCHSGAFASFGLDLASGLSYGNLVRQTSRHDQSLTLVAPADVFNSFLLEKLFPNPEHGSQMPRGRGQLPDADINLIRTWISDGAPLGGFGCED